MGDTSRSDYQFTVRMERAATHDERWSDHAPVTVSYES